MARNHAWSPRGRVRAPFFSRVNKYYYLLHDIKLVPIWEFTEQKLNNAIALAEADEAIGDVFSMISCLLSVIIIK